MTIHVSKDIENSIEAAVLSGRFPSVDAAVTAAWLAFNQQTIQTNSVEPGQLVLDGKVSDEIKPIWQEMLELAAEVPDEEFDKLPADLAEQHDHYNYGIPKRLES